MNQELLNKIESAKGDIKKIHEQYGDQLVVACSFQKESTVILDLFKKNNISPNVFTIDIGDMFKETYEARTEFSNHYELPIATFHATSHAPLELLTMTNLDEESPWQNTLDGCCTEYKQLALQEALGDADAWMTGLRADQGESRSDTKLKQWDNKFDIQKLCPLHDWSEKEVWQYINYYDLPYHKLHDQGYDSIGCAGCTMPGRGREGRWANTERVECGIH